MHPTIYKLNRVNYGITREWVAARHHIGTRNQRDIENNKQNLDRVPTFMMVMIGQIRERTRQCQVLALQSGLSVIYDTEEDYRDHCPLPIILEDPDDNVFLPLTWYNAMMWRLADRGLIKPRLTVFGSGSEAVRA